MKKYYLDDMKEIFKKYNYVMKTSVNYRSGISTRLQSETIEKMAKSQFFDIIFRIFIRSRPETIEKIAK